jgi:hypothetical protein
MGETSVTGTAKLIGDDQKLVEISYNRSGSGNFSVSPHPDMQVVETRGFVEPDENTITLGGRPGFRWNASADTHWIRYSTSDSFPAGKNWIIAPFPLHERATTLQPANEGYIGPRLLYLGPHSTQTVSAGCQSITAIVPNKSSFLLNENQTLSDVQTAASTLDVGHAYEEVRFFVSPADLENDRLGYNLKDSGTVVVQDDNDLTPNTVVWQHEYIHTRQNFNPQPSVMWLREATATYLSYRMAAENGDIYPRVYDKHLALGENINSSIPLSKTDFGSRTNYVQGSAALSLIETKTWDSNRTTVEDLFQSLQRFVDSTSVLSIFS